MRMLLLVLCLVFVLIGAVLGYANHAPVRVDLLFAQFEMPLIVWMLIVFGTGVLLTALVSGVRQRGLRHRCRKAEKRLAALENELRHLRQLGAPGPAPKPRGATPVKALAETP